MREEFDNEKLLIRYLLGDLSEEQRLQVEGGFLGDDRQYERLLVLEDELFYDYAKGTLTPEERGLFEERFLVSGRNRKRMALASALVHTMSETSRAQSPEVSLPDREAREGREERSLWRSLSASMKFSLAALAIMLLVSIWLAIGIVRLRTELNQLRDQRTSEEDRLHQQAQLERDRADDLNLKLKREIDETDLLTQELSKMQAKLQEQGERLPSVISLILAPSFVRDQATGIKKLYIPPSARVLKLQLNLKGEVEYKSYLVRLLTVDGAERWSRDKLQAKRTGSGKSIELSLPSGLLTEGDFELRLKGYASDGTLEETGDYYYFSIVK